MRKILYSFPPGTGGDHVCNMLNDQDDEFDLCKVTNSTNVKWQEHRVAIGQSTMEDYHRELQSALASDLPVIASHRMDFPGTDGMIRVRATWTRSDLTANFVARDILVTDFAEIRPYLGPEWHNLGSRRRWIDLVKNNQQHGCWREHETLPLGWQSFCLDRLFGPAFVNDVLELGQQLGLQLDACATLIRHKKWLDRNQPAQFTVRRAVRHLEHTVATMPGVF